MHLYHSQADSKNIALVNEIDIQLMPVTDNNMIKLVLRNLISNAIKFTGTGGEVRISGKMNNNSMIISVKDNGKGIDSKQIEKIFSSERFTTYGTANEKGTGLGLLLCKEFIERSGGKISVISELGKGSTFTFTVPL